MKLSGQKILIVEDDHPLARMMKMELEANGYNVHTEAEGARALNYAQEQSPDLVILDLRLPDMSGYEVAKRLRRMCQPWALPILMLTGLNEPVDQLRGFAFGADAYLTKPYEPSELLKTISFLL